MDTLMISYAGEAAVSSVSLVDQLNKWQGAREQKTYGPLWKLSCDGWQGTLHPAPGTKFPAPYSHCTWEELKEMADSGLVEVQNHSYDLHQSKKGALGVKKLPGESEEQYRQRLLKKRLTLKLNPYPLRPILFSKNSWELMPEYRRNRPSSNRELGSLVAYPGPDFVCRGLFFL